MGSSIAHSLLMALMSYFAYMQVIAVVAATRSDLSLNWQVPVAGHIVVLALIGGVLVLGWKPWPVILACLLTTSIDIIVVTGVVEPLHIVIFISTPWTLVALILIYRGPAPVLVYCTVTSILAGVMAMAHPLWGIWSAICFAASGLLFGIIAVLWMWVLGSQVAGADDQEQEAARQSHLAISAKVASDAAVEFSRLLHDTVVNTFGALARKESLDLSPSAIRDRCRHDVLRLRMLDRSRNDPGHRDGLLEFGMTGLLPVRSSGLSKSERESLGAVLVGARATALRGCILELIVNSTKHSGADFVNLDVRQDGRQITVTVSDDGCGFDGSIPDGHGLSTSVFGRAADHGISVELHSVPDVGTTATLHCPLSRPVIPEQEDALSDLRIGGVLRTALLSWVGLVAMYSLVLETLVSRGTLTLAHVGVLTVLAMCAAAWLCTRTRATLPGWLSCIILIAFPATNFLALLSVSGSDRPLGTFPIATLMAQIVLLLLSAHPLRWFIVGLGVHLVITVVFAWQTFGPNPDRAVNLTVVELLLVSAVVAWVVMRGILMSTGRRLARAWHRTVETQAQIAAIEASDEVRRRWSSAGLSNSIELLTVIADGRASVTDPAIRKRCADEAARWRRISSLPQDAALMSWWFAMAHLESDARRIELNLQAGGAVLSDTDEANALGRVLLESVTNCAVDSTLEINLVEYAGAPRLFIVGRLDETWVSAESARSGTLEVVRQSLGDRTLVEAFRRRAAQ